MHVRHPICGRRIGMMLASACLIATLTGCDTAPSTSAMPPQSALQKAYLLPAEFFITPVAERGPDGEIYISGTTNFPDGMKMWIVVGPKKAQQEAFVRNGRFRSGPLYKGVAVPVSGRQPVEFIAHFNGAWQGKRVLSLLGEDGKNIRGSLVKLTDPDVDDSGKILDAKFNLWLPPVPADANAITIVKHAILIVPGKGKSATDIEENIKLFESPGTGVTRGKGWTSTPTAAGIYNVVYGFNDGKAGEKQAIWTVNTTTKQVKYVNEAAKLFSWTPNY
jgi:hypothetical protein